MCMLFPPLRANHAEKKEKPPCCPAETHLSSPEADIQCLKNNFAERISLLNPRKMGSNPLHKGKGSSPSSDPSAICSSYLWHAWYIFLLFLSASETSKLIMWVCKTGIFFSSTSVSLVLNVAVLAFLLLVLFNYLFRFWEDPSPWPRRLWNTWYLLVLSYNAWYLMLNLLWALRAGEFSVAILIHACLITVFLVTPSPKSEDEEQVRKIVLPTKDISLYV